MPLIVTEAPHAHEDTPSLKTRQRLEVWMFKTLARLEDQNFNDKARLPRRGAARPDFPGG